MEHSRDWHCNSPEECGTEGCKSCQLPVKPKMELELGGGQGPFPCPSLLRDSDLLDRVLLIVVYLVVSVVDR